MLERIRLYILRTNFSGSLNLLKFTGYGATVNVSRFIFMFYFSTIDTSNQSGVADIVFINGNNALFVSLFLTLVLIPLAQFRTYNFFGILSFLLVSISISFGWTLLYGYSISLAVLTIGVMLASIAYETTRRINFVTKEKSVIKLDLTITSTYLALLACAVVWNFSIYTYLILTSLCIFITSVFFALSTDHASFKEIKFSHFFKLNHSGVGQSLLAFAAGNFIFQLISINGNEKIFTKINIIRIWTAPVGLLLNGLDFVYSRDKYNGNMPSSILKLTLLLSIIILVFLNDETTIYLAAFFLVVPFQFWLRESQIRLRQKEMHKTIWMLNIVFSLLSITFSWLLVSFLPWEYWSWYIIIVYFLLWSLWNLGKRNV